MSYTMRYETTKRALAKKASRKESRPKGFFAELAPKKPYGKTKVR